MAYKVYLYKGDERYLTNTKINRVIKDSKADEINITSYDCSEVNVEKAVFDALTPAFLGGNKVVIITNPVFLEKEKEEKNHNTKLLKSYIDNPMDSTYMIINASGMKVNEKLDIVKALMKKACVINTNGISEVEFRGWLERECAVQNVAIEKAAIATIYRAFGTNLAQAKNEVDKLISYVGAGNTITEEVLDNVMSKGNSNDIYSLINAIFKGQKQKAIEIYLELSKYEKDASIFVNMITKSFRESLLVKMMVEKGLTQEEISSKMKISSSRAYYMIKDSANFKKEALESYIIKLAELDYNIKSGKIDKKIGFEQFLLGIK